MSATQISAAIERFGWNLLAAQEVGQPTQNMFLSPFSIAVALGMLLNGAGARTRAAIVNTLTLPDGDLPEINGSLAALTEALTTPPGRDVRLSVANALWADRSVTLVADFRERCRQHFQAEAQTLDFQSPQAADTINAWVAKNTENKIPTIVSPRDLLPPVEAVLTNAVYFYAPWTDPFRFEMTVRGSFTLEDNTTRTLPMMSQVKSFAYTEGNAWQAVRLPYSDRRFCLDIFLPEKQSSLQELRSTLAEKNPTDALATAPEQITRLVLPRFMLEFKTDLTTPLGALGMEAVFGKGADFTPMGLDHGRYVGSIYHKTMLRIDEKGTEAAAATAVSMEKGLGPDPVREMRIDRPFLCVIRDTRTGVPLFLGAVRDPQTTVPTYEALVGNEGTRREQKIRAQKVLQTVVRQGDTEAVAVLLDAGVNIKYASLRGHRTPLAEAASYGNVDMVHFLLERGADPLGCPKRGDSVVMAAAIGANIDILTLLLDRGAELNCRSERGETALMRAASSGRTELARLLIERGADINIQNEDGETALMRAAHKAGSDIVHLLLEQEASADIQNTHGETPLMRAVRAEQTTLAALLIRHKADVNKKDQYGETALHRAARYAPVDMITLLLDAGADIKMQDQNGKDALRLAAENGRDAAVQVLLKRGADPSATDKQKTSTWAAAARMGQEQSVSLMAERLPRLGLIPAVKANSPALVRRALVLGADPNTADKRAPALLWATRAGHTEDFESWIGFGCRDSEAKRLLEARENEAARENVLLLLHHGADIRARDSNGNGVLSWAASRADPTMLTLLLDCGTAADEASPEGGTPLYTLAQKGKHEAAQVLLERGADPNARYQLPVGTDTDSTINSWYSLRQGTTPLMWAAMGGHLESVHLLLAFGADPHLRDAQGQTAHDWAVRSEHPELAELLPEDR